MKFRKSTLAGMTLGALLALPTLALAEDGVSQGVFVANNVWMMIWSVRSQVPAGGGKKTISLSNTRYICKRPKQTFHES